MTRIAGLTGATLPTVSRACPATPSTVAAMSAVPTASADTSPLVLTDAIAPFELVLAGHMHDGQITIPYPGGKLRLAHPTARFANGVYRSEAAVMHVSPGLGTTFVPFRFAARPEATELVLRSPA